MNYSCCEHCGQCGDVHDEPCDIPGCVEGLSLDEPVGAGTVCECGSAMHTSCR